MKEEEFDRFADEYREAHAANVSISGESPDYFAEYKIVDVAALYTAQGATAPRRIVDIGAGVGNSVPYFRRHFPDSDLACLDVSQRSLRVGEARFPEQARFIHFDGRHIPFGDGEFDLAFVACVLHHVEGRLHQPLLREIHRVLRPDGMLFVFEHNPINPLTVRVVKDCPFDENAVLIRAGDLQKTVIAAGFKSVELRYRLFFPRALRVLRFAERFLTWLPIGAQYSLHARKR